MKTKIALLLAVLTMVIVSVGNASVTVSIDGPYTKDKGDTVTIPITITGYDNFYAGYFLVDFGKVKVKEVGVESETGYIYPLLADYGALTKETEWKALTEWYKTKDAAVDYGLFTSKLKLLWIAPKAQSEVSGPSSGSLFKLKFKVDDQAQSDIIFLGGEVLNNNIKQAKSVGTQALFNVAGTPPVSVISTPAELTALTADQAKNLTSNLDMGGLGGSIPVTVTLKNEGYTPNVNETGLQLKVGTQIQKADGTPYTGFLKPPQAEAYTEWSKEDQEALPAAWKNDAYKISVGAAEKLKLSQKALMLLKVRLKTTNPKVYYLPPVGPPEEAGVEGSETVEGKAYSITKGGTIIGSASAAGGLTDYTIAVLLDHLSTYVVGPALTTPAAAVVPEGDDGTCFIATAAFGSASDWHVKSLRDFRDAYLLKSSWGKAFVDAYYKHSPSIALYLKEHDLLRSVVRAGLVPVAGFAYVAVYYPVLLLLGLILLVGIVAVGVTVRRR